MSLASFFLLGVLLVVLFVDYSTLGKRFPRIVLIELVVFAGGGVLIAFPEISTRFATAVGIHRGVDVVLYLAIIWLVRESILTRHARWRDSERLTELVRVMAIRTAHRRTGQE
jgi:hypothetical protein